MTPDTLRTLDLLPCPFCGDTLVKSIAYAGQQDHPEDPTWWAGCTKCDAGVDAVGERAAITAWNTRAHLDAGWLPIEQAPAATPGRQARILVIGGLFAEPELVLPDGDWWRMRKAKGGVVPTHFMYPPAPPSLPHPPAGEGGRG